MSGADWLWLWLVALSVIGWTTAIAMFIRWLWNRLRNNRCTVYVTLTAPSSNDRKDSKP